MYFPHARILLSLLYTLSHSTLTTALWTLFSYYTYNVKLNNFLKDSEFCFGHVKFKVPTGHIQMEIPIKSRTQATGNAGKAKSEDPNLESSVQRR